MSRATARVVLVIGLLAIGGTLARGAGVVDARAALYAEYASKLGELAAWCGEQQLDQAAEQITAWLPERNPVQLTLFVLPSAVSSPQPAAASSAPWQKRWQGLRDEQADALMALARRAVAEHRPSLAYELVTEAVRENPDHKLARRMLGYVRFRDAWHTPFEIRQLNGNKIFQERFGWLPKSHVERYETGQRYFHGRWMPAAEEAALRADMKRGWRVDSEHYIVTTNHSLEEGVRLSRKLEMLYAVWQQAFAGYLASEAQLASRFEGRAPRREPKQHNVVYYKTRDEYNAALRAVQPQIDISLGIYFARTRTANFFAGADQEPGTLYHEATHQLFQETRQTVAEPGRDDNFWAIEGVACYMETLREHPGGYVTLGGTAEGRLANARYRLLHDDFYVPLAQLAPIGMENLQRDPRISQLYGQAAGLVCFFVHGEAGRYRDPFVRYLDTIYSNHATPQTLAEILGTDYPSLDRAYREFMSRGEIARPQPAAVR